MAGYNYRRGMSRNAVDAYRRNLKPISRFTAQDLRNAYVHISLAFARWLAKRKHWTPAERHHTSKFCNKVNFYAVASLRRHIVLLRGFPAWAGNVAYGASKFSRGLARHGVGVGSVLAGTRVWSC